MKRKISASSTEIKRWWDLGQWRRGSLVVDSTIKIFLVGMGLALLFALASMVLIRDHETKRLMAHVEELLSTVESAVRVACFVGDVTLASDIAGGLLTNRLVAGVKITAGSQILALEQRGGEAGENTVESYVVRRAILSPFSPDETVGEVEITADADFIRTQAAGYSIMSSAVLMLEVVAVVWVVALVMLRRVVRPIRIFSDRTHAIRLDAGEHVTLPEGNADNEIGQLASDFNLMIDKMSSLLAAEQVMGEKIALNELRFRTLVENSPDIIVRYDSDCRRVFVNPAYSRETGISAEQVLNQCTDEISVWRPSMSREEYRARLQQVMDTGVPDQILLEWLRPDEQWVSHEMYVVAEYDAGGAVIGTLAIGRDVTERKAAERQLLHQASYDALTGLPNRRLFGNRLAEEIVKAERGEHMLAVLFIDLDRFKEVNDTLGHVVGDKLLVEAAQRVHGCVRESDTVARLAGDEFVVILPDFGEARTLERVAQNVVTAMGKSFHLEEHSAFVSASVGIAVYPRDAVNAEALIGCADQAMYAAKGKGRNSFSFFTPGMLDQAQQRLQLAGDLREALAAGQLQVYYQPIVDIETGRAVKAEALLRWRHPLYGMVPPDRFVPIAEETGLIHEIGAWVLAEAADTVRLWNAADDAEGLRQISVNVSPRQITQSNGNREILACLQSAGIDPAAIVVEITEGLLLEDRPEVMATLGKLRAAGIQLALDDFGTGYSAMAYLKKFNIDFLKIDRSFVRDLETDPGDRAIAEAIVAMAHRLGLKVIAEGVETEGQLALLAAVGCEYLQGYLFAKPMPAEVFLRFVGADKMDAFAV